jgi:uncharacterized membrane protein YgcG
VSVNIKRIIKHLLQTHWHLRRAFPAPALLAIEQAIKDSEKSHAGEIRFVVEGALHSAPLFKGQSARERALEVFSKLRVWDTQNNNGVLIYLLLADRDVEIVADRGIYWKTAVDEWEKICHTMEAAFKDGDYTDGVVLGIQAVTQQLRTHFPATSAANRLPDTPVML